MQIQMPDDSFKTPKYRLKNSFSLVCSIHRHVYLDHRIYDVADLFYKILVM